MHEDRTTDAAPMENDHKPPRATGPRTAQGKERSRRNSLRHGILAKMVFSDGHSRKSIKDYKTILRVIRSGYSDLDALGELWVEELAFEYLRLTLVHAADAKVAPLVFARIGKTMSEDRPHLMTEFIDKQREAVIVPQELDPELILRYGNSVSKHINRLLDRLEPYRDHSRIGE
jgi:hypothetical protein